MKKFVFIIASVISSFIGNTQVKFFIVNGSITGPGNSPVDAATVFLLKQKDSSIAKSAVSDNQGQYQFNRVQAGKYFISVSAVGFKSFQGNNIELTADDARVQIPVIILVNLPGNLQQVSVVTQRPFVERKIDRLIVNVASSPVYAGQSAYDLLEKSPGVSIDDNGIITINGKQGAQVYIDGKLSYLAGQDLMNYLRSIPSAQLDQIEIMTQPSAKFDAAGNAGILNIKTKKNHADGFNGTITATAIFGYFLKTRDNLTLNWKKNKFNISFNYSFSDYKNFRDAQTSRKYRPDYKTPFTQYLEQYMVNDLRQIPNTPRLSIDYAASKKTNIGMSLAGLFSVNTSHSYGPTDIYDAQNNLTLLEQSYQDTKTSLSHMDFNLNLQQKIGRKGAELDADADYLFYNATTRQESSNYFYDNAHNPFAPFLLNCYLPSHINIYSVKSDFSQPLPGDAKLEAGIKSSYVNINNDAQYQVFDSIQEAWVPAINLINHFIYTENINAAYINASKQLKKKWSIQVGLRAEQTNSRGNELVQQSAFNRSYIQLFPMAYVSYAPNKSNTYSLSYGRRIDRPNYQDLNPFKLVVDQYTFSEGNPFLQPVFSHNIEADYNYKGQVDVLVNYTKTSGLITNVLENVLENNKNITIQTRQNIASRKNIGIALNFNKALTKWWNTSITANLFNNYVDARGSATDTTFSLTTFRIWVSNQFPLKNGWTLDLSAFFLGKRMEGVLIYALPSGSFSFGFSKKILKQKGTLTANMNDPFWMFRGPRVVNDTYTFVSKVTNERENRYCTLTFNYRFGKTFQQKHKNNGSAQDEQNRVGF